MPLDRIILSTFRNHRETQLDGAGKLNLLVGENGAGKTNVLEALSLFAPGRGLRRASLGEMAGAMGNGSFAVSAQLDANDGGEQVKLGTGVQSLAEPAGGSCRSTGRPPVRLALANGSPSGGSPRQWTACLQKVQAGGAATSTGWPSRLIRAMPAQPRSMRPRCESATNCSPI